MLILHNYYCTTSTATTRNTTTTMTTTTSTSTTTTAATTTSVARLLLSVNHHIMVMLRISSMLRMAEDVCDNSNHNSNLPDLTVPVEDPEDDVNVTSVVSCSEDEVKLMRTNSKKVSYR